MGGFFKVNNYWTLMRFHRPVGIGLLLWPTLWALWIAGKGHPTLKNLIIFIVGTVITRAAGCVINDIADQKWDRFVARTQHRPLTAGKVSRKAAFILVSILCSMAFVLVCFTNFYTVLLAVGAVCIAMIYPFMKRYTYWPQGVLGLAFSMGIPMAFTAELQRLPFVAVILFLANFAWIVAYDTEYALADRADDIAVGIKSMAILFGKYSQAMIGLCQGVFLLLLGGCFQFSMIYCFMVLCVLIFFVYQHYLIKQGKYIESFSNNQWVGIIVWLGVVVSQ